METESAVQACPAVGCRKMARVSSRLRTNAQLQLCGNSMISCVRLPASQCRKRAAADAKLEGDEQIAAESERLRQRCELFEQELQRLEKEKLEARDHADVLQHQLRWVPPCVITCRVD